MFNTTYLNSNLEWKKVGYIEGTQEITLPSDWKELMVIANANNTTALVGSWYLIREVVNELSCRYTQGTGASYITVWININKVSIYKGIINNTDVTNASALNVYYR